MMFAFLPPSHTGGRVGGGGGGGTPIAYQRIIHDSEVPEAWLMREVAAGYPELEHKILKEPAAPFYAMTFSKYGKEIGEFYEQAKSKGETVVEASRFSIHPTVRSLQVVKFAVESILAHELIARGNDWGITGTHTALARFYKRFGFQEVPGTETEILESNNVSFTILLIAKQNLTADFLRRIEKMGAICRQYGATWLHPDEPDNLEPPRLKVAIPGRQRHALALG